MPGWKGVDEIVAYKLSVQLRDDILQLTGRGSLSRDWTLVNQIRDSARSAPRNLSEGFKRYGHGDFARFTTIAVSSLEETRNHLKDGRTQNHISAEDFDRLDRLADEAMRTCMGLLRYLQSSDAPTPASCRKKLSRRTSQKKRTRAH